MKSEEVRFLQQLEGENKRLNKFVADLKLENKILKDILGENW